MLVLCFCCCGYLELTSFVELCISESDSAKLKILFKHCFVVDGEVGLVGLVDDLGHADDVTQRILDGVTHHGTRPVARDDVNFLQESTHIFFQAFFQKYRGNGRLNGNERER